MSMKKKLGFIIGIGVLTFSMAACGAEGSQKERNESIEQSSQQEQRGGGDYTMYGGNYVRILHEDYQMRQDLAERIGAALEDYSCDVKEITEVREDGNGGYYITYTDVADTIWVDQHVIVPEQGPVYIKEKQVTDPEESQIADQDKIQAGDSKREQVMDPDQEENDTVDVGEEYIKDCVPGDVVFDQETGLRYVKNQIIVSAEIGTPKEQMNSVADALGADIVGYLEFSADFQLEFRQDMSFKELQDCISEICENDFVRYASLNLASEITVDD